MTRSGEWSIWSKVTSIIFSGEKKMKASGMLKLFLGAMLTCILLCAAGCETIPGGTAQKPFSGFSAETYRSEKLCTLLTKEEVGSVLKVKMAEPKFFVNECTFKPAQPSSFISFNIQISTDDGSQFNYNKESGRTQGRKIVAVKGIGDSAYFDDSFLNVLKGNVWLNFSTASHGRQPSKAAIKALAKMAVDRIQ
jgi:hypothetical protein